MFGAGRLNRNIVFFVFYEIRMYLKRHNYNRYVQHCF